MFTRDPSSLRPEPHRAISDLMIRGLDSHVDFIPGRTSAFYGLIARNKNTQADFAVAIRAPKDWWNGGTTLRLTWSVRAGSGRGPVAHGFDRSSTLKIDSIADCGVCWKPGRCRSCRIVRRPTGGVAQATGASQHEKTVVNRAKAARASLHCDGTVWSADQLFVMENERKEVRHHDVVQVARPRWQHEFVRISIAAHRVVAHRQLLDLVPKLRFAFRVSSTMSM